MPKGIPRNVSVQKLAIHRYKIAKGHLEKVIKMLDDGEYCLDVVHQSIAVQAALKSADQVVLKNHLQTCVAESIRNGNDKEAIDEIMGVIEKR
jgi:DNA-binding FrmR family transcriptional regulator